MNIYFSKKYEIFHLEKNWNYKCNDSFFLFDPDKKKNPPRLTKKPSFNQEQLLIYLFIKL